LINFFNIKESNYSKQAIFKTVQKSFRYLLSASIHSHSLKQQLWNNGLGKLVWTFTWMVHLLQQLVFKNNKSLLELGIKAKTIIGTKIVFFLHENVRTSWSM